MSWTMIATPLLSIKTSCASASSRLGKHWQMDTRWALTFEEYAKVNIYMTDTSGHFLRGQLPLNIWFGARCPPSAMGKIHPESQVLRGETTPIHIIILSHLFHSWVPFGSTEISALSLPIFLHKRLSEMSERNLHGYSKHQRY